MPLETGIATGLAQSLQYDQRIADLRYQQHQQKIAQAENEAKAKMFSDDLEFQNAANSFDNPRIKEYAKQQIFKIGQFVRENPDYASDVNKLSQLNLMKRELKDNPELLRGVASDNSYKAMIGDLQEVAKNPQQHDIEAYNELQNQWNNYQQFGNQFGIEAAKKEGLKPFIYTKPKEFVNLPETLLKLGNSIQNYDVKKGKNIGEYWTEPNIDDVKAIKDAAYQEHGRQIRVEARKQGIPENQIDDWVSKQIAAGFKKHYSIGDANAAFENAMALKRFNAERAGKKEEEQRFTTWDDLVHPKNTAGYINQDVARKVWGDKPPMQMSGNNGKVADLTGYDFNYDGRYLTSNGIKFLSGYVDLPLDVAEAKGMYQQGWLTRDGITSDFLDKATVEEKEDKNGDLQKYVRVQYQLPINPRDKTAKSIYEVNSMPSKLVPSPTQTTSEQRPKTVIQNGYTYTWNENTQTYE